MAGDSAVLPKAHGSVLQAPVMDWDNGLKLAYTGTAAQSAAISSTAVLLCADTTCFVKMGDNPTASDAATSVRLPFDQWVMLGIEAGQKISAIRDTADGNLYIIPIKII